MIAIESRATAIAYTKDAIRRGDARDIREGYVWIAAFGSVHMSEDARGMAAKRYVSRLLTSAGLCPAAILGA